jgi:hypothetical protein
MGRVRNRAAMPANRASDERSLAVDRWCNRAGQLSQVLLLALGVFGYFYTVLPIYQKAVLDEDIAQKTLELREQEKRVATLNGQIANKERELASRDQALSAASARATAAIGEARKNYQLVLTQVVGASVSHLQGCASPFSLIDPKDWKLQSCGEEALKKMDTLLGELRKQDRDLLAAALRKHLTNYQAEFETITKEFNVRQQETKLRTAEIAKQMQENKTEGERAKRDGSAMPPGYFTRSAELFSQWADARMAELKPAGDADDRFRVLLKKAGDGAINEFFAATH